MVSTSPTRSPWLLAAAMALVLMVAMVIAGKDLYFNTVILEQGDAAVNALQIDNAKHGKEIYGNYSRFHFNHPGPVVFYADALGELVLRDWLDLVPTPHNAHLLASLLMQVCCFALALAILHTWFESWLFLVLALLAGLWHFSLVQGAFNSVWPPHVVVMPFFCFIVAASSFAAGRIRDLAAMIVTGGILFHSHVAQPLFVGGLGGLATFLHWRREKQAATWPGWRAWAAAHRGLLSFCGAWTALMLLPLAIDVCLYGLESNVATVVRRFLLNTTEHKSVLQSLLYLLSFPTYASNQEDFLTELTPASYRFFVDHLPILLSWLVGLGGTALLAWFRRDRLSVPLRNFLGAAYVVWGATAVLCIVWGLVQAGPMFQFNGVFYHGVYYFLGLLGLGTLIHFFGRNCPPPIIVVLCCLASIMATWNFRLLPGPNEEVGQRIRNGVAMTLAKHPPRNPVLLVFEHYCWPEAIAVALDLQRRGIPFYTSPSWNFMVGRKHDSRLLGPAPETAATVWWITRPAPDGITIAKDLAIFTEPAVLDPRGTQISFALQANGFRHLVTGLSTGNVAHAWTDQKRLALTFQPLPAPADVQLIFEIQNNPRPESRAPQTGQVFFNGVPLGSIIASEHAHFSLTVPQTLWNSTARAVLEVRFPQAEPIHLFSQPASESWAAWGLWRLIFATPDESAPATTQFLLDPVRPPAARDTLPELPAVDGRIDFTKAGNLARFHPTGLGQPATDLTRTTQRNVEMLFRPGSTDAPVQLQIVAEPFGGSHTQRCELYINDQMVFSAPFVGPGVIRTIIPSALWNARPIGTIRLHLPDAAPTSIGSPAQGLALRWLATGSVR